MTTTAVQNTMANRLTSLIRSASRNKIGRQLLLNYKLTNTVFQPLVKVEKQLWRVPKFSQQVVDFFDQRLTKVRPHTILTKRAKRLFIMPTIIPLSLYLVMIKALNRGLHSAYTDYDPSIIQSTDQRLRYLLVTYPKAKTPWLPHNFMLNSVYDEIGLGDIYKSLHDALSAIDDINNMGKKKLKTADVRIPVIDAASAIAFRPYWSSVDSCVVLTDSAAELVCLAKNIESLMESFYTVSHDNYYRYYNPMAYKKFLKHASIVNLLNYLKIMTPNAFLRHRNQIYPQLNYICDATVRKGA